MLFPARLCPVPLFRGHSKELTKPLRESVILMAICVLDLIFTVYLLNGHRAVEANPLLAAWLRLGLGAFIAIKLLLTFAPIMALEMLRTRNPRFVQQMLRVAICVYILLYILGGAGINHA